MNGITQQDIIRQGIQLTIQFGAFALGSFVTNSKRSRVVVLGSTVVGYCCYHVANRYFSESKSSDGLVKTGKKVALSIAFLFLNTYIFTRKFQSISKAIEPRTNLICCGALAVTLSHLFDVFFPKTSKRKTFINQVPQAQGRGNNTSRRAQDRALRGSSKVPQGPTSTSTSSSMLDNKGGHEKGSSNIRTSLMSDQQDRGGSSSTTSDDRIDTMRQHAQYGASHGSPTVPQGPTSTNISLTPLMDQPDEDGHVESSLNKQDAVVTLVPRSTTNSRSNNSSDSGSDREEKEGPSIFG